MADRYLFPGVHAFVDAGGVKPDFAAKVGSEWFVRRATDAVEQMAAAPPEAREAVLAEATDALDALRACVKTVEAVIAHARHGLNLDEPSTPEATPERPKRSARSPQGLPRDSSLRPRGDGPRHDDHGGD